MTDARYEVRLVPRLCLVAAVALVSTCLLCAAGCSPGQPYRPVQVMGDESVIHVYRRGSIVSPGSLAVYVDQIEVGRLARNRHISVIVAPGEHIVRLERRSTATRIVRLLEGESVYLEAGASLLGGAVSLVRPGTDEARERLGGTRRVAGPVRMSELPSGPDLQAQDGSDAR